MEPGRTDSLGPQLRDAELTLQRALAEACLTKRPSRANTGELIRIDEVLRLASEATKRAYSLSSNRSSPESEPDFGGAGWALGPDGDVLAVTDRTDPIRTVTLELAVAERAKGTYPRYALR